MTFVYLWPGCEYPSPMTNLHPFIAAFIMRHGLEFDTLTSALEVLWDVLIVFAIIKIGLIYFISIFASWELTEYLSHTLLWDKHISQTQFKSLLAGSRIAATILWARLIIQQYDLPSLQWFRLAIGVSAMTLLAAAESAVGYFLHRHEDGRMSTPPLEEGISKGSIALVVTYCPIPLAFLGRQPRSSPVQSVTVTHDHKKPR